MALNRKAGKIMVNKSSLEDWYCLAAGRKWIILSAVLGAALIAYVVSGLVRPEWETVGFLQVARVPVAMSPHVESNESVIIEPTMMVMERLKSLAITQEIAHLVTTPKDVDSIFSSSLIKTKLFPGTDLIEIRVRGGSPAKSKEYFDASVAYIAALHDTLKRERREYIRAQLEVLQSQLLELRQQTNGNNKHKLSVTRQSDIAFALMRIQQQTEQREAATVLASVLRLEFLLQSFDQAKTSLFGAVVVGNQPVFPQRILIAILAAMAGFTASVAWALWKAMRSAA